MSVREISSPSRPTKACSHSTRGGLQERKRVQKLAGPFQVEALNRYITLLHSIGQASQTASTDSRAEETDLIGEGVKSHYKGP